MLRSVFYIYTSDIVCQFLFGILLLFYVPTLDRFPGYTPIRAVVFVDNTEYEPLPWGEQICPERHANLVSKIFFTWMILLMQLGYKRPITEKDVWKLDTWDETKTLYSKFQKCWLHESQKPKPCLLRALCFSLGGKGELVSMVAAIARVGGFLRSAVLRAASMSLGSSSVASGTRTSRSFEYGRTNVVRSKGRHLATIVWLHGLGDTGSRRCGWGMKNWYKCMKRLGDAGHIILKLVRMNNRGDGFMCCLSLMSLKGATGRGWLITTAGGGKPHNNDNSSSSADKTKPNIAPPRPSTDSCCNCKTKPNIAAPRPSTDSCCN